MAEVLILRHSKCLRLRPNTAQSHLALLSTACYLRPRGVSSKHFYHSSNLTHGLYEADSIVHALVENEKQKQKALINLVPSANIVGQCVLDATGTVLQNPNSEGYVGRKYYPGTKYMDEIETLCQRRALRLFDLDDTVWSVNVQSHSPALSRLQACSAILRPHERLLALESTHGSFLAKYFNTLIFNKARSSDIYYEALKDTIRLYQPRVLMSSICASEQRLDYQAVGHFCRSLDIYLLADITEISGLVASQLIASPFEHADIVIAGTQGSLRGPAGALIFSRKTASVQRTDVKHTEMERSLPDAIDQSVFPGHQGGPHNHAIMAVAVALLQAKMPPFEQYQRLVLANAEALANRLIQLGYCLNVNPTPTHHLVVNLKTIDARLAKQVLDAIGIASNVVVADNELHIGTLAMTSRGILPGGFRWVADFVHGALSLAQRLGSTGLDELKDGFEDGMHSTGAAVKTGQSCGICAAEIHKIREDIKDWIQDTAGISN